MITREEITAAGTFTKTHGLKGELHALLDIDAEFFIEHNCFVVDVDGIFVPFFVETMRPKGHAAVLIKPEDIDDESGAKLFVGKTIYVNSRLLSEFEQENAGDEQGAYADDFIGFRLLDEKDELLGEITAVETSTANTLFIVATPDDKTLYVPVAEEFVIGVDFELRSISMNLPQGLINLNN